MSGGSAVHHSANLRYGYASGVFLRPELERTKEMKLLSLSCVYLAVTGDTANPSCRSAYCLRYVPSGEVRHKAQARELHSSGASEQR